MKWYINKVKEGVINLSIDKRFEEAWNISCKLAEESILQCSKIGDLGKDLILKNFKNKQVINILTHCNAGWLACIDWGTALAPIYKLYDQGVKVHVWVDETRPRSQGAFLTTWELSKHGVPNTLIVDNAGGHLMQSGKVDMCIVGSDRTAANGDVCNKIGTYLKALSAYDNDVPFYVALPETTIDLSLSSGINKIPIEERSSREVTHLMGVGTKGETIEVRLSEKNINIFNPGFDVTPNKYVTKLITNRGVCEASKEGINKLREELKRKSVWAEGIKQELERNIAKRIGIERQLSELYLKLAEKEQVELPNSFATQVLGALKRSSFGVGHSAKDIQKTINNIQAKMGALLEKEKKKSTLGPMFLMDFESLETHIAFVRLETQKIRNLLKALDKDLDDKTKISNIIDYEKRTMH